MKLFKIKVGNAAHEGYNALLKFNGDYYTVTKKIQRKDETEGFVVERIELSDLFWDKSDVAHPVGYYTACWINEEGKNQSQERVITVISEIKLELGL